MSAIVREDGEQECICRVPAEGAGVRSVSGDAAGPQEPPLRPRLLSGMSGAPTSAEEKNQLSGMQTGIHIISN